jgi:hypothetical protein
MRKVTGTRWHAAVLAVSVVASWGRAARATAPPTIYDNYQMFPIGSRAAGMGGAYTALACDEAAIHYNPAALACASSSRLELSANAYVIQSFSVPNALGRGEDVSAVTFHPIPTIVGGVRVLRDGDEAAKSGRLAFGLSVSVPQSLGLKVGPSNPRNVNSVAFSVRDDVTAADVGIAYQLHRFIGVGVSFGAVLRTYESFSTTLIASGPGIPCGQGNALRCNDFVMQAVTEELVALGGRGRLGVRVTPTQALSFGLAVTSPTFHVWGEDEVNVNLSGSYTTLIDRFFGAGPTRLRAGSQVGFPLRIALGGAYSTPRFTLSADASINVFVGGVRTAYDVRRQAIVGVNGPSSLPDTELQPALQPNVNLGAEFSVARDKVIDVGLFTDLSSVSSRDMDRYGLDRVHMFGGSVALGLLGKQARAWFGLSFEVGAAETRVPSGAFTFEELIQNGGTLALDSTSTITRWTLAGILGANYSFVRED